MKLYQFLSSSRAISTISRRSIYDKFFVQSFMALTLPFAGKLLLVVFKP
jgi:hypothetical protein